MKEFNYESSTDRKQHIGFSQYVYNISKADFMKKFINKQFLLNLTIFIILPFFINIVLESLGNKYFFGGIEKLINDPYVFLCNTLIITSTLSFGVFFRRFRGFWIALISVCWIALGTVNYILLCNRVLPFTAYDLQLLDTLPFIIRKYLNPFSLAVVCLCIVIALLCFVALFFRALSSPKVKTPFKKATIFFIVIISMTFGNLHYAISSGPLEARFPELTKSYVANGFAYSFMRSFVDNGVEKVDGYSQALIDSISEKFVTSDNKTVKTPNIIFVQLESFFDPNSIDSIEFSENPVPNFTKLVADNPSGLLTVPVIGAGTVNTEFEVVTGMRVADFGAAEYPYKTILKTSTCESIATNLKNYGYTSHFMHNYKGTFYGRNTVYANLGYDNFYSIEYMTGYETNENGWAKDNILLRYINECLDSTDGSDLITAISVQAHGNYIGKTDFTKHITITDCDNESLRSSYEYYINQIYEVDQFLGELVNSISQREEETILVIYGDHLPALEFKNEDLIDRTIYQTDYLIWNNMGLEYDDEDLNAYQLSSKVLDSINITDGVINSCHQQYKEDEQYSTYLQALEYDVLYGEKFAYNGENPYPVSKMKKNLRKIEIHNIVKKDNEDDIYVVTGTGFTDKCFVRIGYRVVFTSYINEHTLEFKSNSLDSQVPISVWEKDVGESNNYKSRDEIE